METLKQTIEKASQNRSIFTVYEKDEHDIFECRFQRTNLGWSVTSKLNGRYANDIEFYSSDATLFDVFKKAAGAPGATFSSFFGMESQYEH